MRRTVAAVCVVAGTAAVLCLCRSSEGPVPAKGAHRAPSGEIASFKSAAPVRNNPQSGTSGNGAHVQPCGKSVSVEAAEKLFADIGREATKEQRGAAASEKNQLMDELLNQPTIPADYGATMIALFRDETQDVVTRDFAVQHIGLYAKALNRRGRYNPDSRDAYDCRAALFDAADENRTIVAAAALRALAEMSAFDGRIDARGLDARLVSNVGDKSSAPAVRVMSAQLCGERKIVGAKFALQQIVEDAGESEILRRAASWALKAL